MVQIKMLIAAMISRVGTTAFGPPTMTRTGNEVRTIATLSRADLRTMLRRLGRGDASGLLGTISGVSGGGFMVILATDVIIVDWLQIDDPWSHM